jgi:hypothetical protein
MEEFEKGSKGTDGYSGNLGCKKQKAAVRVAIDKNFKVCSIL